MVRKKKVLGVLVTVSAICLLTLLFLCGCGGGRAVDNSVTKFNVSDPKLDANAHYVLVVGNDKWNDIAGVHSDMMMLARVDVQNSQISLLTVPRDTRYITEDGSVIKANDAYSSEGIEGALKAVRQITGLNVTDYIDIGFEGLEKTVDKIGGLRVNLPYDIDYVFYTYDHPVEHLKAGEQVINGWQSMVVSRARACYEKEGLDQDMVRQVVDRQMAANLISAVLKDKDNPIALATDLLPNVKTNIETQIFVGWVKDLLKQDKVTVFCNSGPTTGEIDKDANIWLCDKDPESWSALMNSFTAGEDITAVNANTKCQESDIAPIRTTYTIDLR